MPSEVQGYDLDGSLTSEEVEDVFSRGTRVANCGRVYTVKELRRGPELLGTVESDSSLWVLFEESGTSFEVGNALHALKTGSWQIMDDEDHSEFVERQRSTSTPAPTTER